MKTHKILKIAAVILFAATADLFAATYIVTSISELNSRLSSAIAGDEIVVRDGTYTTTGYINISRAATAANPIVVRAETVGGVEIAGSHGFSLNSGAAHVHIQGFKFTHIADRNRINSGATFCRFTRNIFECSGTGNYLLVAGHDARVDRNVFRNKSTVGNMIDVRGSGSQIARRVWIHHNYFHDFAPTGQNGAETLRFGLSGLSMSTGDGLIEHNLFVRCRGENELISNKASGNTYRYNTFLDSAGGEMSQRHGNDCLYYGNYMRNTSGIRVYGDRHKIFSNYLANNSIGVAMGNGGGEVADGAPLTSHDRPDDNIVAFNTFVNNNTHYSMIGRSGGLGSSNTVVANNIFQGGGSMASISSTGPYTGRWTNNVRWQTSSAGSMPSSGYTTVNPQLAQDASGVFRLQSGSPMIHAAVTGAFDHYGRFVSFAFVNADMDGQPRDGTPDIGADEFSSAPVMARILTTNDVGPSSVEGLALHLSASPSSRFVASGGGTVYLLDAGMPPGTSGVISLSAAGLPPEATHAFGRTSITNSGGTSLVVITTDLTPPGTYTIEISGTVSNTTVTIPVTLAVGDFTLTATPAARTVVAGKRTEYTVHLATNDYFSGFVTLGTEGLPEGVQGMFAPPLRAGSGSSLLIVTVPANAAGGTYEISATAQGGAAGGKVRAPLGTLQVVPLPKLEAATTPAQGLVVSGSGGIPGAAYTIRATSDIALPMSAWAVIATGALNEEGAFSVTSGLDAEGEHRFFALEVQ